MMGNEKRLIDANALSDKLKQHHDFFVNSWGGFSNLPLEYKARVDEIMHCIAEIFNAKTVDAVPQYATTDERRLIMNPCEDCHRPVGVNCCHNCKKDANKCGEYHGCGSCNAWEQGIFTNADRIRAMSDEELARFICGCCECDVHCPGVKLCMFGGSKANGLLKWLQQPAE